jgi:hypothetical protein
VKVNVLQPTGVVMKVAQAHDWRLLDHEPKGDVVSAEVLRFYCTRCLTIERRTP